MELYRQWCIFCDDIHKWILVCKNVYLLKEKVVRIISGLMLRQLFSLMHRWHYLILAILFRSFGFIACMDDFLLKLFVFPFFRQWWWRFQKLVVRTNNLISTLLFQHYFSYIVAVSFIVCETGRVYKPSTDLISHRFRYVSLYCKLFSSITLYFTSFVCPNGLILWQICLNSKQTEHTRGHPTTKSWWRP